MPGVQKKNLATPRQRISNRAVLLHGDELRASGVREGGAGAELEHLLVGYHGCFLLTGVALHTRRASRMWENNIAFYNQCLRATPKSLRAYIVLGQRHRENGELDAALDLYERALRKALVYEPYLVRAAETLGDLAFRDGRYDEAVYYYRGCVRLGRQDLRSKLEAAARMAAGAREP